MVSIASKFTLMNKTCIIVRIHHLLPFRAATPGTSQTCVTCLFYMNEKADRKSNRHIIHQYQVTVLSAERIQLTMSWQSHPDSKVQRANMGPTWVLSAPDEPHVGPMNLAIRAAYQTCHSPLSSGVWRLKGGRYNKILGSWSRNEILVGSMLNLAIAHVWYTHPFSIQVQIWHEQFSKNQNA